MSIKIQSGFGVRGVQQGSPHSPLFFSLALQEVLVELRPLFDDASWKIRYLDDGTMFGSLDLLEQVLARLEQTLPRMGLGLNLRKCVLVSSLRPEDDRFTRLADVTHIDIRDESKGFKVLSVPIGGRLYVKKALKALEMKQKPLETIANHQIPTSTDCKPLEITANQTETKPKPLENAENY